DHDVMHTHKLSNINVHWRRCSVPTVLFFPRIPSFPHAFSGNPGAGTGPPIKTFGGDVLGVAIPSLHRQFSRSKWRLSRGIVFFRGYFSSSKSHRLALKRCLLCHLILSYQEVVLVT